jgi:CMP-N-acetylneuraminic acid synthetase
MKTLAVVCARAGSERLPGKNLLPLQGHPLVYRVIFAAQKADTVTDVIVSTDDDKLLAMLNDTAFGKELLLRRRPSRLATAKAAIEDALLDALDTAEAATGKAYDNVIFLPANSAVVTHQLINRCVFRLTNELKATACMTVKPVSEPPEWMWTEGIGYQLFPAYPTDRKKAHRMQDVPRRFIATGTVNVVRTEVLRKNRKGGAYNWMGHWILGVADPDAIEIHTQRDYQLAQLIVEGGK